MPTKCLSFRDVEGYLDGDAIIDVEEMMEDKENRPGFWDDAPRYVEALRNKGFDEAADELERKHDRLLRIRTTHV